MNAYHLYATVLLFWMVEFSSTGNVIAATSTLFGFFVFSYLGEKEGGE